jgi:hypothetical protein
MSLAFRIIYTVAILVCFSLGLILHLKTPIARPTWYPWCALNFIALVFVLREISRRNFPFGQVSRFFFQDFPRLGLSTGVLLIGILGPSLLYILLEHYSPKGIGYLLKSFISFGIWAPIGAMLFFGFKLASLKLSKLDSIITVLSLILFVFIFVKEICFYQARILLIAIFCLIFMIKGNRFFKILVASTMALYVLLGVLVLIGHYERFYPEFFWAFAGMSEINAAFDLILRQTVMRMAGLWGTGGAYISEVGLPLSSEMSFNCLPYLSLVGGIFSVGLYALSLFLIMASLLLNIFSIKGWAGTVAVSVWFILAVDDYMSFLSLVTPSALMLGGGTNGLPFIGSFETSLILLLLMLFVFAAKRMESGVMLSNAATYVVLSSAAKEPSEGLVAEREENQEKQET